MLESVTEQPKRIRLPKRVSWRLGGLLSFAGLIGLLGFFLPTMLAQQAAWAAAIGLGLSAGLMFLSARQHQIKSAMALQVAQTAIRHDSCPSLVSCVDGTVLYANDAAKQRFGDDLGGDVSATLANYVANPDGTTFRLVALAQQKGAVQEEIITRDGTMHISAHQIGSEKYLWRIDETAPAAPMDAAPALPTLILGSSGAVLSANDAATALAGHPVKTLADLFPVLPLVSGEIVEISCVHGTTQALISEVDMGAGRKAIYLLPPVEPRKPDGEWTAFQDLPVPLVKVTPDGMIESFNRMATALVGTSLAENVHLSKLMEGLGRSITDWLTEMIEGRSGQNSEFLRLKRTDKEMFIQVTLNKVVEGGTPSLIAVLSDATELKSLEAQFVQSQKMQAIGQLAGGVAHDFNNLLTAISGHCDLLLLRHDQGDPDFSDLVQINQNANRAAALVGQLLAFSRKQTLRPEIVDMRDTLADLTHLLNRLVGEKVTLTLSHDPVLKAIRADKRQLEQVLMNLVVNARDAMPSGGEIRITTECLFLSEALERDRVSVPAGEYVTVQVADEGTGIQADKLQKVFEPFFTTKRTGEGTGLGLSTAYGIVKQTGGYIFVDSEMGVGTKFTLYFPVIDAPEDKVSNVPKAVPKEIVKHAEGVVLLVEDEAPVRAFAGRALRLRGYTVLEADSAEAALKTLEDESLVVDIFVTDIVMPGMDGPTWVREALKSRPDVRIVFVSGYAEDSFGETQTQIPNSVFLPKPFSLNELTETVHRQLS